jgi:hypothetical protein
MGGMWANIEPSWPERLAAQPKAQAKERGRAREKTRTRLQELLATAQAEVRRFQDALAALEHESG